MLLPPRLPRSVRAANLGGRAMGHLGLPIARLDQDRLLAEARKQARLEDFGDASFRLNLTRLLDALEREAELSLLGRHITRATLVSYLVNRLRIVDCHQRHPEIAQGPIARPIFIIGMPRTGTSLLHELMAQDPKNRTPLSWEVSHSVPAPETATYLTDPRIALEEARCAQTDRLIPDFKRIHRVGARLPQECVVLMGHDFASMENAAIYGIPAYSRWLADEADLAPTYRFHRMHAQLLQWKHPGEQWVFKSPCHLWRLPALLAEYPDAILVQTHRDPLKILASSIRLALTVRSLFSDRLDPCQIAAERAERDQTALDRSVAARESGIVAPGQALDLQFAEIAADPVAAVRRIYQFAGRALSDDAETRMRRYLAENPHDRLLRPCSAFSDTGLVQAEVRRRAHRYQDYFRVASEELV